MKLLNGIGIAAAVANYRKAKRKYEQAIEKQEALQAAIDTYTEARDSMSSKSDDAYYNQNAPLQGILATTILRIGNLVPTINKIQMSVVLTNTTENAYTITKVEVQPRLFGTAIGTQEGVGLERELNTYLEPGETKEIQLSGANTVVQAETKSQLKSAICTAAGKKLITSCPKLNVDGIESADIVFWWKAKSGAGSAKRARYVDMPGLLRYCGEAFYPGKVY